MHMDIVHSLTSFDCGHHFRSLFYPKESALGAMGIQCCDSKPRPFDAPTLQFTMCQVYYANETITLNHPNRLRKWYVCRKQNNSQVSRNESHRVFLGTRQMREELSMSRKTIAAKEQSSFVYWSGCDCIDVPGSTQLDCCLNVSRGSFPRCP